MKKLTYIFCSALLLVSMSACGTSVESSIPQQPESSDIAAEPSSSQPESDGSLKAWEGTWNSFYSYFENPGLEEAYETLASREGIPSEQIKMRYLDEKTYQCDIAAFRIEGDAITFYSKTQDSKGSTENIETTASYTYAGEVTDGNGLEWAHFESGDSNPYSHLLLLPAEADVPGETMVHFHFRYGDDLDTLLASDGWYATMTEYDSDISLLVGHMTLRDIALSNWSGTWNSFYTYFQDPGLEEAYATLAQREGITAAEVKARYLEGKTYQCEIVALGIDEDSVTFYSKTQDTEGSSENITATAKYSYIGEETDNFDRTWAHFETSEDVPYKHLFLLPTEADNPGSTMLHYHFRYGNSVDELKGAEGWYATMVKYDSDIALLAGHMTFED